VLARLTSSPSRSNAIPRSARNRVCVTDTSTCGEAADRTSGPSARLTTLVRNHSAVGVPRGPDPVLTASSPEGARDYLVPSRLYPASSMRSPKPPTVQAAADGGGVERYFQIAPCFRDEASRADRPWRLLPDRPGDGFRHPGRCVRRVETLFGRIVDELSAKRTSLPLPASATGSGRPLRHDKPDLRFGLEIGTSPHHSAGRPSCPCSRGPHARQVIRVLRPLEPPVVP